MLDVIKARNDQLGIDQALRYAVTMAWEDFTPNKPRSIHVEYLCEPGTPIDHLSVWSLRAGGYQDLLCNYWMKTSPAHPSGARFENGSDSASLSLALDFIMKNQALFTRPAGADRHGLVQILPPDADDRAEAAAGRRAIERLEAEASKPSNDHKQDEEAWSRMDGDGYPHERDTTQPGARLSR